MKRDSLALCRICLVDVGLIDSVCTRIIQVQALLESLQHHGLSLTTFNLLFPETVRMRTCKPWNNVFVCPDGSSL